MKKLIFLVLSFNLFIQCCDRMPLATTSESIVYHYIMSLLLLDERKDDFVQYVKNLNALRDYFNLHKKNKTEDILKWTEKQYCSFLRLQKDSEMPIFILERAEQSPVRENDVFKLKLISTILTKRTMYPVFDYVKKLCERVDDFAKSNGEQSFILTKKD